MDLSIGKWGNSLAVRIPAELARQLDLKEGDTVTTALMPDGVLALRTKKWSRAAYAAELEQFHRGMKMGESVVEEMRNERY